MSTDIVDKDLKALRNGRWDKAFKKEHRSNNDNKRDAVNRKATIVIEHIIQASDISHTMQHWQVYRKWVSLQSLLHKVEGSFRLMWMLRRSCFSLS